MALGNALTIEIGEDSAGQITTRLVSRERGDDGGIVPDMRRHYTLSGTFPPTHQYAIVAGQAVEIRPPAAFTLYSVLYFDAVTSFIGLGRVAGDDPGTYDYRHPGSGEVKERVEATDLFTILFNVVPANPVEVVFYAGEPARAT